MVKIKGNSKTDFGTWETFKAKVKDYILFGIPAIDKKGHSEVIQFRVIPFMLDIFAELKQKMPPGWLRDSKTGKSVNNSMLHRCIYLTGCEVYKQILQEDSGKIFTKLDQEMKLLNNIRKIIRLNELMIEKENLQDDLTKSNLPQKHKLVKEVEEIFNNMKKVIDN